MSGEIGSVIDVEVVYVLYSRNSLSFSHRNECQNDNVDAVWIELPRTNSDQLIIGCLYRPPNADVNYLQLMFDMLEVIMAEGKEVIVLGDMNYDYKTDKYDMNNPITEIEDLFLMTQIVNEPRRETETSSKCLGHILTTILECHDLCGVAKISVSDHYLIYTSVECKRNYASHNIIILILILKPSSKILTNVKCYVIRTIQVIRWKFNGTGGNLRS